MWRLRTIASRLHGLFAGKRADRELDREVEEHLQLLAERYIRQGMSPEDAESAARRQFGGITKLREEQRESRGIPAVGIVFRDLHWSFRLLRKRPGFSLTAIAVLTLGIAATTAVYSVAKAVIFTPLPFPRADRLVLIFESTVGEHFEPGRRNLSSVRPGTFQDWQDRSRSFASMAAVQNIRASVKDGDRALVADGFLAGQGFFETLGIPARIGRYLTASDYAADGGQVVVLADRFWRDRYNADPSIIGREIVLNGAAHLVIGVMPPGFLPTAYGNEPQFWLPLRWEPASKFSFVIWGITVYARLKDGLTLAQAQSEMDGVAAHMRSAHPGDFTNGVIVAPLAGYLFGGHERMFVLLLAAVGLVLLIACANVANLLLARALERRREFALRSAIGASRAAILRQVLAESLVLAMIGGMAGACFSPLLMRPALALLPPGNLPRLDRVQIDAGVLLFALAVSVVTGLLFGVIPASRAGRGDLSLALRTGGRGSSLASRERRLSDVLVVAEIAFSLVLLVAGGQLGFAFLKLVRADPGFRPAQSVAVRLSIPSYRYGVYEEGGRNVPRQVLYRRIEQSASAIADVESVGLTLRVPLRQFWNPEGVAIEGRPPATGRDGAPAISKRWGIPIHGQASLQTVSPGYFAALGIPLIRGRVFDERDRAGAPMSAVVNEAMVRRFFPKEDPIGRRIAVDAGTSFLRRMTIVGIAGDARLDGMNQEVLPEVFGAMEQAPVADVWIVARAKGDPRSIESALRRVVRDADPEVAVVEVAAMSSLVGESLWRERFSSLLVGLFAALAALIATAGMYAVIAHAVERRRHELGVRLALGATHAQIAQTVLGHGLQVTGIGLAFGALLTMVMGRLLAQQSYKTNELPWMFIGFAGLLMALTLLACWLPLRRALRVDPVTTLRAE